MSLAKVPFVLFFTVCYNICIKPPHPPPPSEERVSSTRLDVPAHTFWRVDGSLFVQKVAAVLEILTIFAASLPSMPGTSSFLTLWRDGAGSIRLNTFSAFGVALIAIGTLIRLSTYRALGSFFRYQISIQKNHKLIIHGPYSIVRHPSYTGLVFAITGWFFWTGASGSWLRESTILDTLVGKAFAAWYSIWVMLGILGVTLGRMSTEDAALQNKFGEEWDKWSKKVPYSIIPGVY